MAWVLDSGRYQHRVRGMHTLGLEDKRVLEREGKLYLSSTNPTFVNEKLTCSRGNPIELHAGDLIQIGKRKIRVIYSPVFISATLMRTVSGFFSLLLLLAVASSHELNSETVLVFVSSVVVAIGMSSTLFGKSVWSVRASTLNFVLVMSLSLALSEGMLRFAHSELQVSNERMPTSIIDTP